MQKTSDLEVLPRYIYGVTIIVTLLALLLVFYLYWQNEKTFQLERRLSAIHLPTIVALNVIDKGLGEIEKSLILARSRMGLEAGNSNVPLSDSKVHDRLGAQLHLIKTRMALIVGLQRDLSGSLFEASTGQLQAAVARLENLLVKSLNAGPGAAVGDFTGAVTYAQNRVEQLNRLHLKASTKLAGRLSMIERSSARNIAIAVTLALLFGGIVVGRLLYLLHASLADKRATDQQLIDYRDHLEELVAERSRELEASNRELESYSYSIAHDLRTPLRTMTSFSQILQEDAALKLNSEEKQNLERVVNAGKYMAQLIDDILELSRITRAKLESDRFDLSRLAREIATRLDQAYPERRIEWRIQEGLYVDASRLLLEVCLDNLFGNACKYTAKIDPARIEFGAMAQSGERVYFVKDNGIGFDIQYAGKLFKPFQRLHHQDDYAGTGVGLATVERVISRHGGRIWASSEEGKGTTFLFTLSS